jgi:hypothetical protein
VRIARGAANAAHVPDRYWPRVVTIDTGHWRFDDWKLAKNPNSRRDLLQAGELALRRWLEDN